jgi:hypothetical protein
MLEQGIRLSRAKRRFMYKEEAMKALEKMAPQTAGEFASSLYIKRRLALDNRIPCSNI